MACTFCGSDDRDQKLVAVDRIRDRADALEDVQRDELGGLRRDAALDDVDERKVVPLGERTSDALSLREPFVDERLRERARPGAIANEGDLVSRQEPCRLDDVRNELGQRVDLERTLERSRAASSGAALSASGHGPQHGWPLGFHTSNEVSAAAAARLSA